MEVMLTKTEPTAAGFLAKKSGHNMDAKTTEKVTDGARGLYEKFTGWVLLFVSPPPSLLKIYLSVCSDVCGMCRKKVDPKYSN